MIVRVGDYLHDRYEILSKIGMGGMSEVYKADDCKLNRTVAIKVLKEEYSYDENFVNNFKKEAQAAAKLQHPNIVNVYDVVDEGDLHFIVMELVTGITLKEFIKNKGYLTNKETLGISLNVAMGIAAAHEHKIIHRDIKPQNIIISEEGKVKVTDFGLARAASTQTLMSAAMGSVHYISPEQAKGEATDERSDIYSFGITLFEMITGRVPFDGDNSVSVAISQIEGNMPSASSLNPGASPAIDQIILKCTQKKKERRYQSIESVIIDLRRAIQDPNTDLSKTYSQNDTLGETRVISQEELGEINSAVKKSSAKVKQKKEAEEYYEPDNKSGIFKTIAIVLLALAILAVAILIIRNLLNSVKETASDFSKEFTAKNEIIVDTQIPAPGVIGLNVDLARQKLTEASLDIKIREYKNSDIFDKDTIISQEPFENEIVSRYSQVYVTVSLGPSAIDINQYGLKGADPSKAQKILESAGFTVVIDHAFDDEIEIGKVADFIPKEAEEGDKITLFVSYGPEADAVLVPVITGVTEEEAMIRLTEAGLILGEISQEMSETVPRGIIIRQEPEAESFLSSGGTVNYVLSTGNTPPDALYVGSIDQTCNLSTKLGPGYSDSGLKVYVRLHQVVDGQDVYTVKMDTREIRGTALLSIRYINMEGAPGVEEGYIEVVNADNENILQSYLVQFFPAQVN